MRLAVVTDEIDGDLSRALRVAGELGLVDVELNGIWGRNIVELDEAETARVLRGIRSGGFRVCCVSTPAFKALTLDGEGALRDYPEFERHLAWVRRGCELAGRLGAPYVRLFSFRRPGMVGLGNPSPRLPGGGPIPDAVLAAVAAGLRAAAAVSEAEGVKLVLENVRSCWGNTATNAARILEAAAHPGLRAVWDPANDYVSGTCPGIAAADSWLPGYEALRPLIAHVHVKNAVVEEPETGRTRWARVGGGDLDLSPALERLRDGGYEGAVVLETHWRGDGLTPEESTRASFADLLRIAA